MGGKLDDGFSVYPLTRSERCGDLLTPRRQQAALFGFAGPVPSR
jgi:hypothetical protein